jgi:hypothetical protein
LASLGSGTASAAAAIPRTIEAENFDTGGEGVGYHDNTLGNQGNAGFRTGESVDIFRSNDSAGGRYVIKNFQVGEWLAYTVNVPSGGSYDIDVRAATSSSSPDGAFRFDVDGVDKTGTVTLPSTGGWNKYQWVGKRRIVLTAGTHVVKLVVARPSFTLNSIRVRAVPAPQPYFGTPIAIPGAFDAAHFDLGGEGVAYHDNTGGNQGDGQFRTGEAVDIFYSNDTVGSAYIVKNFEANEWLAYTISVPATGQYDIELRAATNVDFPNSAFRVEVDGVNATGTVVLPDTGGWSNYQWLGKKTVTLTAGTHVLKLVSERPYFGLSRLRVVVPGSVTPPPPPPPPPPPDPSAIVFSCTFVSGPTDCGFQEQGKVPGRATLVNIARDGATGVRLHTEPGDNDVSGSGAMERNDLWLTQADSDGFEGREAWWAHSFYLPDDFVIPGWHNYVFADFHNSGLGGGQANFHVLNRNGVLTFQGYGGVTVGNEPVNPFSAPIGPIQKNVWYDFVYHVRWSSGSDGFFDAWVNGVRKLSHRGPTVYAGQGVYLKLANYHVPVCDPYPACIGTHAGSSIIHDRVIRGTTPLAVSSGPLEGVLTLVNGVLTPIVP